MKHSIYMKSALRQPLHTLFLLLLLGLISFAFISRAAQYLIVQRETGRLEQYYRPIGSLLPSDGEDSDAGAGAALVAESPYVDFEDRRRYFSGILEGIYNADVDGYSSDRADDAYSMGLHISDVLVYGELIDKMYVKSLGAAGSYRLRLRVDTVEAGYPEYVSEGKSVWLRYPVPETTADTDTDTGAAKALEALEALEVGKRYFLKAYYNPTRGSSGWKSVGTDGNSLLLKPLNDEGLWFLPAAPGESIDWEDPALSELRTELAVLRENQHAMLVTTTADMSSMPEAQETSRRLYLAQGRWLNREDDQNSRRVCVIHNEFAELRGLSVGDTITLKLRDLKHYYSWGYITNPDSEMQKEIPDYESVWDTWRSLDTSTESFEIVGLYGIIPLNPVELTNRNTQLYIPNSCLPDGYGGSQQNLYYSSYSFVLKSFRDQNAFIAENKAELARLGITLSFVDNNAQNFYSSADPLKQSASASAGLFALVLVLALALVTFLYLRQRRREFAILRTLGVPKGSAVRRLLWPVSLTGALGILAGGVSSWRYALGKAAETLASLQGPEGAESSAALSSVWLAVMCGAIAALLLIFTLAGALWMARRPVLVLLQDKESRAAGKRKPKKKQEHQSLMQAVPADSAAAGQSAISMAAQPAASVAVQPAASVAAQFTASVAVQPAASVAAQPAASVDTMSVRRGNMSRLAALARYALRHIRRSAFRSILTAAVALCFAVALGWLNWTIENNRTETDRLYESTVVEAEIVKSQPSVGLAGAGSGFIRAQTVEAVLDSGFVQSAYLEAGMLSPFAAVRTADGINMERSVKDVGLRAFNQPEQFFSGTGKGIVIEYAEGWDESFLSSSSQTGVLLPAGMLQQLMLKPGDTVIVTLPYSDTGLSMRNLTVAGQYTGTVPGEAGPNVILMNLGLLDEMTEESGRELNYVTARFILDPAKNRELPSFRERMKELAAGPDAGLLDLNFVFWDEELTRVIEPMEKNLKLLSVLYPAVVNVSVLIAAGLAVLMMLQRAKESAVLRVLGTTKSRTRILLCTEHILLCLLGLLLGLGILAALRGGIHAALSGRAVGCAGLYLAGCLCGALPGAIHITNRMPLELLQIKE